MAGSGAETGGVGCGRETGVAVDGPLLKPGLRKVLREGVAYPEVEENGRVMFDSRLTRYRRL